MGAFSVIPHDLKRKFVANLGLIILLNLLIKPLWIFAIDIKVQNMVGTEEFGLYGSILNFSFLLNILLDFGITNYNNRNISQNHQLLRKYFSNIVVMKFLMAVFYAVMTIAAALIWDIRGRQLNLLYLMIFNQFLISFALYLRSNIAGMQMHTLNSLISVLDRGLMIIFVAVLIWGKIDGLSLTIEWFVYAQTAAYVVTTLICFFIVAWKSKFPKLRFDSKFFMVVLRQSLPYALLVLLMTGYTRIDAVLLDRLLGGEGKTQVGIYIHSFRIFDAAYQFALLFAVLLLPMFSKMIKDKLCIRELTKLSALLLFIPSIILAVVAQVFRVEIIDLFYEDEIAQSARFFGIMMFAFLGMAGTIIFGTLLTANGSMKELNITSAIALVLNLVLNLLLIPQYKAMGAAIAALVAQSFVGFSQYLISARKFKFSFDPTLILKIGLFVILVVLLGWLASSIEYTWWIEMAALVTISLLLAFALSLIDLKAMIKLVLNGDKHES